MTHSPSAPLALLTIPEVARLLHLSGDTVRRQIREGDLPAIRVGTTPAGRPRYRVPSQAIQRLLGEDVAPDPLEPLRAVFAELSDEQRTTLLLQAVAWAKEQRPDVSMEGRTPQPAAEELQAKFAERRQRLQEKV